MDTLLSSATRTSLQPGFLERSPDTLPVSHSHGRQAHFTSPCRRTYSRLLIRAINPNFNPWKPPNDTSKKSVGLPGSQGRNRLPSMDPPALGSFKPPPLPIPGMFMPPPSMRGAPLSPEEEAAKREKDERMSALLELVRDSRGSWQERAAAIQVLQQEGGYPTEKLYEATYVSYDKQMAMVVAAQVYESLLAEGTAEEVLAALSESYIGHLYMLRTLSVHQRRTAAEYMIENGLDAAGAQELARAIKDHERRPLGREGFTTAPGDCLAFMLHRAAAEATDRETRDRAIERALSVVVSESARRRLEAFAASSA